MKRKICMVLCFIMVLSISLKMTVGAKEIEYTLISTAEELYTLINSNKDGHFRLVNDIDISEYNNGLWNSIGSKETPFCGVLDGNGYTISNFTNIVSKWTDEEVFMCDVYYGGLFSYINGALIENLNIENIQVNRGIGGDYYYFGSIAGGSKNSTVKNCHIKSGNFRLYDSNATWSYCGGSLGGIVGDAESTEIINVSNYCNLYIYGDSASVYVGGITGKSGSIKESINNGTIYGGGFLSDGYVGGITGYGGDISECINKGDVTLYLNSHHGSGTYAGGISGYKSTVKNSYNTANVSCTVKNGDSWYASASGICLNAIEEKSCYNVGSITINSVSKLNYYISDKGTVMESDMHHKANYTNYDFNNIWDISSSINGGYPYLQWEKEHIYNSAIIIDGSVDDYIIGEVKKYTSSGDLAQYNAIMSSDASWEEKFRRLNEFFNNEGLTDIKEGTKYLTESNSYRYAYNCLTTNEIYGAFNYYNWLYSTKSGLAARSALYTSGLIFNYEVFSYMDLSTYSENDYPGVKKNKTLLKEIMGNDSNSTLCDIFDYSNKTAKFLKNIVSLNKITMDNEMEALMDKIINCTSKDESKKLQKEFVEKIITITGATNSINMFSDNFADALDSASDILSFAGATVEDIVALSNLDADIELYKKNSKFLYTIYSNPDVSFEMRLAAYQLYDEIENGYYNKVVSMLNNVIDFSLDKMYTDKSMLRTFLESQGISESGSGLFADALGTIKLATYITNIIIDTGDFVNQVAYTQGYAELSTLYSIKLEEDKQAFLANETAENAWNFFKDYTMLWKLRYNGEQQYLDMSKVKVFIFDSIKTYKYEEKKELVQDNLEMLNKCKFKLAAETTIPKSVQYEKKSVVKCPVDVYVYNSEGALIATLKDGEESDVTNNYGRFAVIKESYSGEYAKVICQSTTEDLTIKMIAVDDGLVDYQSLATASTDVKTMDKLIVDTGNSIEVNNDSYSVDTNSDGNADINGTLIIKDTNSYVAVESLSTADDNIMLISGQSKTIGVTITPANATNTALEWISLDKGVATVQNGLIKAIGSGTTTIIVRACDSNEIEREIAVTVLDKMEYEVLSHICNENSLVGTIRVKNNVDSNILATMYVAIYGNNGAFKNVFLTPIKLTANGKIIVDINIENYIYTTGDYIKVFIWGEKQTPFCKTEKTLLVHIE